MTTVGVKGLREIGLGLEYGNWKTERLLVRVVSNGRPSSRPTIDAVKSLTDCYNTLRSTNMLPTLLIGHPRSLTRTVVDATTFGHKSVRG